MIDVKIITFMNLSKHKSFTKTARVMNLTQPAVTQHIQWLENYYQVQLINRSQRKITLTEEGLLLLKYAEKMVTINNQVLNQLHNKSSIVKKYSIGCSLTIGEYVIPPLLLDYKMQYPNIEILMHVENTETILSKIASEEIILGCVEGVFDQKRFKSRQFMTDEIFLVGAGNSPLANRESISLDELEGLKLIMRESGSGTRKYFDTILKEKGFELDRLNIYMEIGNLNAIKYLVKANLGYTILSKGVMKQELESGELKIIPIENFEMKRDFSFVYLDADFERNFIDHFMDFCYDHNSY